MFENRYKLDKTAYMTARLINPMYRAEFCHLSENAVYIAYNEKQPLYTIRISRTDYRTKSNLEGEINWLCMLKNLPVTTPVKVKGKYINCINGYFVVVFKYIVGDMPDYNNCDVMYQCGKIAAMLHKSPKPHNADRPVWSVENMTGIDGLWKPWAARR